MIILPAGTEKTWGEASTPLEWLRLSNKLISQSTDQLCAGNVAIADDWHLLSHIALDHYWRLRDDELLEQYRRWAA